MTSASRSMNTLERVAPSQIVFSPAQHKALCLLLKNESSTYAAITRTGVHQFDYEPTGEFIETVIDRHVATVTGTIKPGDETAFVPSSWNGFRPRSHHLTMKLRVTADTDPLLLEKKAQRLFRCFQAYSYRRCTLLEHCGDGSWQMWSISAGFSSHATLLKLMGRAADDAAIDLRECSFSPSPNSTFALPAPGSWDPKSGQPSQIVYSDVAAILGRTEFIS